MASYGSCAAHPSFLVWWRPLDQPLGGKGSLPWLSLLLIRPSLLWIRNSVPWLRLISRARSIASCFVLWCELARGAPPLFTSQPPFGFDTTWCVSGPLAIVTIFARLLYE